jgi:hypothetical protein
MSTNATCMRVRVVAFDGVYGAYKCVEWEVSTRLRVGDAFSHACFCSDGEHPVHFAARGGHSSTVSLLIDENADVNARDK